MSKSPQTAGVYDGSEFRSKACTEKGCVHVASNAVALKIHLAKDHETDGDYQDIDDSTRIGYS